MRSFSAVRLRRPSPAMAVALLALVVSLGGTAGATVIITSNSQVGPSTISGAFPPSGDTANLIAGSVGGNDLHNGSIGNGKLGTSSVNSSKIQDGSIQPADLSTAARGADAWGTVDGSGTLTSSHNVVGITSPTAGTFCIQLTPGTPAGAVVASPDFATDSTSIGVNAPQAVVESRLLASDCTNQPAPDVEVLTFVRSWNPPTLVLQTQGFEFAVG